MNAVKYVFGHLNSGKTTLLSPVHLWASWSEASGRSFCVVDVADVHRCWSTPPINVVQRLCRHLQNRTSEIACDIFFNYVLVQIHTPNLMDFTGVTNAHGPSLTPANSMQVSSKKCGVDWRASQVPTHLGQLLHLYSTWWSNWPRYFGTSLVLFYSVPEWPEDWIIFQSLAIYNNENLPSSIINCQSWYKCLPNTKYHNKNCPDF